MESETLAKESNDKQSSYRIIAYPGQMVPKNYESLIYSKWLRSLKFGNEYFRLIDDEAYFSVYHKYIEVILSRPSCLVRFAVLSDDMDVALGFSVCEGLTLHYVHVHKDNLRMGIAKSIVPNNIKYFTHITKKALRIWNNPNYKHLKFNPFI